MPQLLPVNNYICYRCRKSESSTQQMIACSYCGTSWHLECLIEPLPSIPEGAWTCPKHRGERTPVSLLQ
ncbi:hypothetical protein BDF20DRAFT_352538 [Mycotypha africana]|uniref:uncharacterized protein n=1 Tax=Mycotypha africana TaxID=64632 RepID=UPI002300A965|nr:uncharacterized protein BDF20DRAFT_352538 [Mycotypha africana]KAI8966972.1 hypothetical protein BDF20DRAFT_352538 [Mycotypha africana]